MAANFAARPLRRLLPGSPSWAACGASDGPMRYICLRATVYNVSRGRNAPRVLPLRRRVASTALTCRKSADADVDKAAAKNAVPARALPSVQQHMPRGAFWQEMAERGRAQGAHDADGESR